MSSLQDLSGSWVHTWTLHPYKRQETKALLDLNPTLEAENGPQSTPPSADSGLDILDYKSITENDTVSTDAVLS